MDTTRPDPLSGLSQRLPPSNLQAEQALLGALLANNKAYDRVGEFLRPEHFADPVHARIFEAIARRVSAGQIADPVTLRQDFDNSNILEEAGGNAYLAQLLAAMVGIINAGDYGRVIHDSWMRRELIDVGEILINRCFAPPDGMTAPEIMEELDVSLMQIADGSGDMRPAIPAAVAVAAAVDAAAAAGQRESNLAGITTGYDAIDRMTGGMLAGEVYLAAGRPGMGKSGLALGIAARAASAGVHTLMWSGEMSATQLGTRLAAAHAGLDVLSVFRGKGWVLPDNPYPDQKSELKMLPAADWDRLMRAQRDARDLPLTFDDRAGVTIAGLKTRARRLKRASKLQLLVIDYAGLVRASREMMKRSLYEQLTEISRDIKMMAGELEVPVLLLAQLSRENERRENKMPKLSDLRDSGALEQDAYCVMFIHRPHYYLMQEGEPVRAAKETVEAFNERTDLWHQMVAQTNRLALINVAKNRGGPTGITRLRFQGETIWFRDESEGERSAAWGNDLLGGG